jgi:eukaryotic-like serine/threonine-protein kinase
MDRADVGPYANLRKLGRGGMGDVYAAWDSRLRRQVALKCVRADRSPGELSRRLLREARALARLSHPGIVQVYDILEEAPDLWIVMEYVAGETAAARLARGPLPHADVVGLGLQLLDALAAAHAAGVIHRDIKPSNVILTPDGRARLLDFGLALSETGTPRKPGLDETTPSFSKGPDPRERVGTPAYMAPEVQRGEAVDERTDLYSLGVTLYEMATRWRPFQPSAPPVSGSTDASSPLNDPTLPPELGRVLARAAAFERGARFSSALDMRRALADLTRQARRRRGVRRALAATALGAAVVAASLPWAMRPATAPEPAVVAVLPLAGVGDHPSAKPLAVGVADVLITTLARVPGTTVVSRSATLPFRARDQDLRTVARELGATWVVDGVVQRSQEQVRVTLSLVHPRSGVVAWSSSYDASFSDVFQLQREVADALATANARHRETRGRVTSHAAPAPASRIVPCRKPSRHQGVLYGIAEYAANMSAV